MKNKKLIITLSAIGAALLILIISVISSYNGLVSKEEKVKTSYSNIEVQLERRLTLIPKLVEVLKDYKDYNQETLIAVTEARNALAKAVESGNLEQQATASAQVDVAVGTWLNAVSEAYPDLKDEQYNKLSDELAGTENRIAVARKDYNDIVEKYNVSVRRFPSSIVAGMFGFEKAELFKASPAAGQDYDLGLN